MKGYISILLLVLYAYDTQALRCVCAITSRDTSPLNVRSGNSSADPVIGQAYPNDCMLSKDECPGDWCQVVYNNSIAYVSKLFVSGPQVCGHSSTGNCFGNYCGTSPPVVRGCDPGALGCGYYGASRGSRTHSGSDVQCAANQTIYAPFNGTITRRARPYGDSTCCDNGFEFVSTDGNWPNYKMKVFYAKVNATGVAKKAGDAIATHIGLHCGCYKPPMTDHSHVQLYISNVLVDPTSFLYCKAFL